MGEALKAAGNNVEYVQADYLAQFPGLESGDLDVAMEIWQTTGKEAMDASLATGNTVDLGETGMEAKEEWWYPAYMVEKCPGLPNWEALKEPACAEAFSTAETSPEGRYLGGPVTWGGFDEERVEALDLPFEVVHAGTDAALFAELESAYQRKAPFLGWIYTPHWAPIKYEGDWIQFPEYEEACYSDPGLGLEPRRRLRLRQAARLDQEGRLGRRRGEMAGCLRGDPQLQDRQQDHGRADRQGRSRGAEGRGRGRRLDEGQRGHLEGLDRGLTARPQPAMAEEAVKLAARGVWKLFGARARRLPAHTILNPTPPPSPARGLIPAVADVELAICTGECFVIMGLSGSGKSTLVRCLARLIEPTAGQVLLDGEDLLLRPPAGADPAAAPQARHGVPAFRAAALSHRAGQRRFSRLPCRASTGARARRRALEMIRLVGLDGREQHYPRQLSGGQQQRVGIARSLAVGPELWFLDEPFSALDPLIRREMQNEFLRLQAALRKTIVFITHDFDEAVRLADRIAIMRDGRIVQTGTPEELILHPADDYVAEFTREAPRAKILTARAIMRSAERCCSTLRASSRPGRAWRSSRPRSKARSVPSRWSRPAA